MNRQRIITAILVIIGAFVVSRFVMGGGVTPLKTLLFDLFFFTLFVSALARIGPAKTLGGETGRLVLGIPIFAVVILLSILIEVYLGGPADHSESVIWFYLARSAPIFGFSWTMWSLIRLNLDAWNKRKRRVVIATVLLIFIAVADVPMLIPTLISLYIAIWVIPTGWIEQLRGREKWWMLAIILVAPLVLVLYFGGGIISRQIGMQLLQYGEAVIQIQRTIEIRGNLVAIVGFTLTYHWAFLIIRIIVSALQGGIGISIPIRLKLAFTYMFSTLIPGLLLIALIAVSVYAGIGTMRAKMVCNLLSSELNDMENSLENDGWEAFSFDDSVAVGRYCLREAERKERGTEPGAEQRLWFDPEQTGANWSDIADLLYGQSLQDKVLPGEWVLLEELHAPWPLPDSIVSLMGWTEETQTHSCIIPLEGGKSALCAARRGSCGEEAEVAIRPLTVAVFERYGDLLDADIIFQPVSVVKFDDEKTVAESDMNDSPVSTGKSKRGIIRYDNMPVDLYLLDIISTQNDEAETSFWTGSLYHGVSEFQHSSNSNPDHTWVNGIVVVRTSIPGLLSSLFEMQGLNRVVIYVLVFLALLLLLAVVFSSVLGLGITRTITSAIARLRKGTERLRKGELDTRITVRNRDELGQLAISFNRMISDLKRMMAETAEKERLEHELQIARQIQLRLLPEKLPEVKGFRMHARSDPALEIGGDYYDAYSFPDGRIGFAVGDVSGKGVAAALLANHLKASHEVLATETNEVIQLHEACKRLNRLIYKNSSPEMYITCFIGLLDPVKGTLKYVNAGHDVPILLQGHRVVNLDKGGLIFGALPDAEYKTGNVDFSPGDVLVVYTDGLTEAMNQAGEEYGRERMIESAQKKRSLSAGEILDGLFEEVYEYAGENSIRQDDFTMMVIKAEQDSED